MLDRSVRKESAADRNIYLMTAAVFIIGLLTVMGFLVMDYFRGEKVSATDAPTRTNVDVKRSKDFKTPK